MTQARSLIEAIQPGLWEPDSVVPQPTGYVLTELPRRFMNLEILQPEESFRIERSGVELRYAQTEITPEASRRIGTVEATSKGAALVPGRTVIVEDSFMLRSRPFLSPYFERVDYLHRHELGTHQKEAAAFLRGADRVVFQLVEDSRARILGGPKKRLLRELDREMRR
jgi:hypothetical protein